MIDLFRRIFGRSVAPRVLQVNSAPATAPRERVNLYTAVNSAMIRTEIDEAGDEILVLPSFTLPDNVIMNGGLYPHDEIEKSYQGLAGTLAPMGHPVVNGQFVPASRPEALNRFHVGAWNAKVERRDNRIYVEKRVHVKTAQQSDKGRALLEAVNQGKPIHTSTGIFLRREPVANADGYSWIARDMEFDHDAILLDQPGAATPEQGVGLMVNVASAVPQSLELNKAALLDASQGSGRETLLGQAAQAKWGDAWVMAWDDRTAIVRRDSGNGGEYVSEAVGYTLSNGQIQWADTATAVTRQETWTEKSPIINRILQSIGFALHSKPSENPATAAILEDEDTMKPEEQQAMQDKIVAAVNESLAAQIKPLSDRLGALETNQQTLSDALTANARAQEADKRAKVAEVLGQTVADALTGNALDEAYAKVAGTAAAPLVPGFAPNSQQAAGFKLAVDEGK